MKVLYPGNCSFSRASLSPQLLFPRFRFIFLRRYRYIKEHPPTYSTCIYTKTCRYEHNDVQHWFGRTIIFLRAVRYSTRNT